MSKLFEEIAAKLGAWKRSIKKARGEKGQEWVDTGKEWTDKHMDRLHELEEKLPSGSGFDKGTHLMYGDSKEDKLVFETSYHHMNNHGMYVGWSDVRVTITPTFVGNFDMDIEVERRDESVKEAREAEVLSSKDSFEEYIGQTFSHHLTLPYDPKDN